MGESGAMEKEVEHMMGAQFPFEAMRPNCRRFADGPMEYFRTEFGESNPAWLMAEAEAVAKGFGNRWGLTFRSVVSRIASFLP